MRTLAIVSSGKTEKQKKSDVTTKDQCLNYIPLLIGLIVLLSSTLQIPNYEGHTKLPQWSCQNLNLV